MAENTEEPPSVRVMLQGQSNCWGKGSLSELDHLKGRLSDFKGKPFERVFIMKDWGYEPLHVGVNNEAAVDFGCEFGLAVRWEREANKGNLYIEKQYIDGAPIRCFLKEGTCDENASGCPGPEKGAFFNSMLGKRKNTNRWLKDKNIPYRDVAWIWVQGEGDSDTSVDGYLKYLEEYSKSLMSSLPLLLPRTARMILVLQKPDDVSEPVRNPDEAKIKFKGLHSEMTRLISPTDHYLTEPNFGPRTHLNGKGLVQLGYDAFEKIFEAPHLTVDSM